MESTDGGLKVILKYGRKGYIYRGDRDKKFQQVSEISGETAEI